MRTLRSHTVRQRAFSLMELVAVIAVVLILCALTFGALRTVSDSYHVSTAVQGLSSVFNRARQLAVSQSKYVQVRFYEQNDARDLRSGHYFAVATYLSDSPFYGPEAEYAKRASRGVFKPDGTLHQLPQSIAILKSDVHSVLLNEIAKDPGRKGKDSTGRMAGYDWIAFYFNPKGGIDVPPTTNGPLPPDRCLFTLCVAKQFVSPTLPDNYAILLLDPANGRLQVTRP